MIVVDMIRGMNTKLSRVCRADVFQREERRGFSRPEQLERRIAPAFTGALAGLSATFTGDGADDTLIVTAAGGVLQHNRFSAGDSGFASDTDWDSATAGIQTLPADAASSVAIALGTGTDRVVLGGDGHAARLKAAFTVTNTGADGDTLEVNDAAGTDGLSLTAAATGITGAPINVALAGDGFGKITVRTGAGGDTLALSGFIAALTVIEAGAGNDAVSTTGVNSPLQIDGGAGSDSLQGGVLVDVIHGGPGNDSIFGRAGNDQLFGDEGLDTFTWNPGDNNDTIDGGTGMDLLVFNGAAIAEKFQLFANGTNFFLTRDIASVTMETRGVEQLELALLAGADTVTMSDLSATAMRAVRINVAAFGGGGDGSLDTLQFNGGDADDDLRLSATAAGVRVKGLGAVVDAAGFESTDQLNLNGGLGFDNVFASSAALGQLMVSLTAELSSNAPAPFHLAVPASYEAGKTPSALAAGNLYGKGAVLSNDLVGADA
jgi:hypothetical protein